MNTKIERRIEQIERAVEGDRPSFRARIAKSADQPMPERDEDGVPIIWIGWKDAGVL